MYLERYTLTVVVIKSQPQDGNSEYMQYGVWSPESIQSLRMWTPGLTYLRVADLSNEGHTDGFSA